MNYELAKKLKEAGFPQDKAHFYYSTHTIPETMWCVNIISKKSGVPLDDNLVAIPTLEELIEACGDDFVRLRKSGSLWEAWGYFLKNGHDVHALTSTEAVARLWLALNKEKAPQEGGAN